MDLLQMIQSNLLSVVLGIVVLCILWLKNRGKQTSGRLPPGPPPVPLLGNLLQMDMKAPYKFYVEMSKQYGSVFTVWLGPTPVVVISGYQALREAFVNQGDEFSGRATYPLIMKITKGFGVLVASGHRWKVMRRFTLSTLKNFGMGRRSIEERVQEEAMCLVQSFSLLGELTKIHLKDHLCYSVANVICSIVFGHRYEQDDPNFTLIYKAMDNYFSILNRPIGVLYNTFPKIVGCLPGSHQDMFRTLDQARQYVRGEADKRLKTMDPSNPQDFIEAFLAEILKNKDFPDSEFHYENLLSNTWNLFAAGTETTSSTLRQCFLMMIKFPHVQERVQKEIDEVVGSSRIPRMDDRSKMPYTDAVIHEVQRFMDLAPTSVPHKVMRDTEFHNYLIPEGTMVLPLLSSALSDPELFKNPQEFDPENFLDEDGSFKNNEAFLAFGMGKRVCPGEGLARVELFLFFTSLLQRFTFVGTVPPEEIDITSKCATFGRHPPNYECFIKPRREE
ncbi:cytochrome P450 2M1-like [Osmerus eperlanus]|uniref:cytochrome P450 2M1-like n=1 Tax=Osmerus eperlanus TaxID=29151 RepID=UPI002E10E601